MSRFLALITAFMLMVSCSAEDASCVFVNSKEAAGGVYVFDVDMSEAGASYDISFYSRTAGVHRHNVGLKVRWISPSGESLSETVYMKTITGRGDRELYRSDVIPSEPGIWKLSVLPDDGLHSLLGIGVICKKNNGTR